VIFVCTDERITFYKCILVDIIYPQLDGTEHAMKYVQKNHKDFPKCCVYWLGPLLMQVVTGDVETMKRLLRRPGGEFET